MLATYSMRTSFCSIYVLLFIAFGATAQNSPDLRTAIPVCADAPISGMADGSGDIDDFDPDVIRETGCLEKGSNISANIEHNTSWYVFRAGTDGQIGFDLEALSPTAEWDFALYGPDVDPVDIGNGNAQPIRCNYEVNNTDFTGIGVNPGNGQQGEPPLTANQNTYDTWLDVKAGEMYYLFINNYNTNFDGDPEPYLLTFTGSSVDADQVSALDCTLRDEFLGLDIIACQADPSITLSALRSPAGPDIQSVTWSVDYGDDGSMDGTLPGTGPFGGELVVPMTVSTTGRYYVDIQTSFGAIQDDILITVHGTPELGEVKVLADMADRNDIEIVPAQEGEYEYAINGGVFQESPVFLNVPPGENTVVISDLRGCGTSDYFPFLVIGYPKFFTPNGDGVHDDWNVYGIAELETANIYIFDRYGKLLKQLDKSSTGWDGTFNGQPMPSSDYWFRMEYSRQEEGILVAHTLQNHFTLKR